MSKDLIIKIEYGGLGDHLFFSHIPRIAKETNSYDKVYVSLLSKYRNPYYKQFIWECNPYVDGFTDALETKRTEVNIDYSVMNLLDSIMLSYGIDDGKRYHEPELYYKPKFKEEYNKIIYDPNWISNAGNLKVSDIEDYFNDNNIKLDAVMKKLGDNALFNYDKKDTEVLETKTLEDFCDLIYSSKELYCLTTGTATLSCALNKKSFVFYTKYVGRPFQHSLINQYILLNIDLSNIIKKAVFNLCGIKITLKANDEQIKNMAWWIPIKKLRELFVSKFKIEDQTRPDQTRPDQT